MYALYNGKIGIYIRKGGISVKYDEEITFSEEELEELLRDLPNVLRDFSDKPKTEENEGGKRDD